MSFMDLFKPRSFKDQLEELADMSGIDDGYHGALYRPPSPIVTVPPGPWLVAEETGTGFKIMVEEGGVLRPIASTFDFERGGSVRARAVAKHIAASADAPSIVRELLDLLETNEIGEGQLAPGSIKNARAWLKRFE